MAASTMGSRSSKIVHAPSVQPYTDAAMIGQNYENKMDLIIAVYDKQKKEVRFIAETKESPYVSTSGARDSTRVTVVYSKINNQITEICHE